MREGQKGESRRESETSRQLAPFATLLLPPCGSIPAPSKQAVSTSSKGSNSSALADHPHPQARANGLCSCRSARRPWSMHPNEAWRCESQAQDRHTRTLYRSRRGWNQHAPSGNLQTRRGPSVMNEHPAIPLSQFCFCPSPSSAQFIQTRFRFPAAPPPTPFHQVSAACLEASTPRDQATPRFSVPAHNFFFGASACPMARRDIHPSTHPSRSSTSPSPFILPRKPPRHSPRHVRNIRVWCAGSALSTLTILETSGQSEAVLVGGLRRLRSGLDSPASR